MFVSLSGGVPVMPSPLSGSAGPLAPPQGLTTRGDWASVPAADRGAPTALEVRVRGWEGPPVGGSAGRRPRVRVSSRLRFHSAGRSRWEGAEWNLGTEGPRTLGGRPE